MELDSTDEQVLDCLLEDGRMSYREIAERTGVTPPTIKSRIDSLKEQGVIKGFTVTIDEEKLVGEGQLVTALVMVETDAASVEEVHDELAGSEKAKAVMKTADSTIVTKFSGRRQELRELLSGLPDAVTGYRTILVTEESQERPRLSR